MSRFLQDEDYDSQIKGEIRKLLDGSSPSQQNPYKLIISENKAIQQFKHWVGGRVDCDAVFDQTGDSRDFFVVMLIIDLALYHLYSQTGSKDVPEHRSSRYEDALDWLKKTGRGEIDTQLPSIISDEKPGDIRFWSKGIDDDDY